MNPTSPGYYFFHGVRRVRNNQRIAIDAPVQVIEIMMGERRWLLVLMLGRHGKLPLSQFEGEWSPLGVPA